MPISMAISMPIAIKKPKPTMGPVASTPLSFICFASMLVVMSVFTAPSVVLAADTPEVLISKVADNFIGALKEEKISNDPTKGKEQIKRIVDTHLSPAIDFRRIAYRTMAKNYKKASTKQFLAFTESIKKSLINTYTNPLIELDSQQVAKLLAVEIRESRITGKKKNTAVVATWLIVGANEKYDVVYYLYFKESKDTWLVENISVEGINLALSFRNQFQRLFSEYGGDYDKVTQVWATSKVDE
ncbi:MAG: ABC transporter substrate-binding protein [Candidatus Portiera sp.]|nr:ABC transporter substrate-binding protein [Portiera sp.]